MRARLPALLHTAGRTAALMRGAVRTGPRRSLGRSVPATSRPVDRSFFFFNGKEKLILESTSDPPLCKRPFVSHSRKCGCGLGARKADFLTQLQWSRAGRHLLGLSANEGVAAERPPGPGPFPRALSPEVQPRSRRWAQNKQHSDFSGSRKSPDTCSRGISL